MKVQGRGIRLDGMPVHSHEALQHSPLALQHFSLLGDDVVNVFLNGGVLLADGLLDASLHGGLDGSLSGNVLCHVESVGRR